MNQTDKKEFTAPTVEHIQFEESNVIETSGEVTQPESGQQEQGGQGQGGQGQGGQRPWPWGWR